MSDGGDCRTAPATVGPKETNLFIYFLYIIQLTHILCDLPRENTFETNKKNLSIVWDCFQNKM